MRHLVLLMILIHAAGSPASALAAVPPAPLTCVANAAVPPTVPAEKLDALVGDVVLACTGGIPTAAGAPVPQVNLTVFVNTAVTSKLDGSAISEALLVVDEPAPAAQAVCAAPGPCAVTGTGTGIGTYDGSAGRPNVFQGTVLGNQVHWTDIPIDAPGDGPPRIFRITNVRANANGISAGPGGSPGAIQMLVSASGPVSIPINNPTVVVAHVIAGQTFSIRTADGAAAPNGILLAQESGRNQALASDATASGCVDLRLRYAENFPAAFRLRNIAGGGAVTPIAQNLPGTIYDTETGFYNPLFPNLGAHEIGLADHGTRLIARFSNVPAGVRLYVSTAPVSSSGGMTARLIAAAADGSGAYSVRPGTASIAASCPYIAAGVLAEVALTNGSGTAVWEITGADPLQPDSVDFGVAAAWNPEPAAGRIAVRGGYAPLSNVISASADAPAPRFADIAASSNMLAIAATLQIPATGPAALIALACLLGLGAGRTLAARRRRPRAL